MALVKSTSVITPQQVADELNRMGHSVSVRQLRDWRGKGLLPPLTTKGRGRGLGRESYWEDAQIVQRAVAVHELLGKRERIPDGHYLEIWFAGYEVDVTKARKVWLSSLTRIKSEWLKDASSKTECEDAIGNWFVDLSKRLSDEAWAGNADLDWERLEPLLLELLNVYLNPYHDIEIVIDEQIAETARGLMQRNGEHSKGSDLLTMPELEKWLAFIHTNLSIGAMQRLVLAATAEDLSTAHRRWQLVLEIVRQLSAKANGGRFPEDAAHLGKRITIQLGGLCIYWLLWLEKNGKGALIDFHLEKARRNLGTNGVQSGISGRMAE